MYSFTFYLSLLTLTNSLKLTKLENPFLPWNLGTSRLTYSYHTFIHYFNYQDIETQLDSIHKSIELITKKFYSLGADELKTKDTIININFKDLEFTYQKTINKYNNLVPHIKTRPKRGALNAVGSIYKWSFGLLDSEDGERYDQAIKALDENQQTMYKSLNEQISLSNLIITRLNNTLKTINENQINIMQHVNKLQDNLQNWYANTIIMITLENLSRQILNNCLTVIELINELENAIMFAHLNTVHISVIKTNEIESMLQFIQEQYPKNSLIEFNEIMSYYQIMSIQVFFENDKIIFATHFPLVKPTKYQIYKNIPIPQNNILIITDSLYTLSSHDGNLAIHHECPKIEDIYLCHIEETTSTNCDFTLTDQVTKTCPTRPVNITNNIIVQIDNYIIIVPKEPTTIKENCVRDTITSVSTPTLLEIIDNCSLIIDDLVYQTKKTKINSKPLILPDVQIKPQPETSQFEKIHLKDLQISKLTELRDSVKAMNPMTPIEYTSHRISTLIITIIIFVLLTLIGLWYRYLGCQMLRKKSIKKISPLEMVPMNPEHPENQPVPEKRFFKP